MARRRFEIFLIKPSRYDEDGYVVQWRRTIVASNSLACVNALFADCAAKQVLGPDVEIGLHPADECNTVIDVNRIIRTIGAAGGGMVGLVGVQSNQFPRALDLARQFRAAGTTLLLVSHDRAAIVSLCDRAILIDKGTIRMDGHPESVLDLYNAIVAEKEGYTVRQTIGEDGRARNTSGTGEAAIDKVVLLDETGAETDILKVGARVTLQVDTSLLADIPGFVVGYMIKDRLGQPVFGTNTYHLGKPLKELEAGEKLSLRFTFDVNFGEGSYSVAVALHEGDTHLGRNYCWQDLALTFSVVNTDKSRFVGISWAPPELELVR